MVGKAASNLTAHLADVDKRLLHDPAFIPPLAIRTLKLFGWRSRPYLPMNVVAPPSVCSRILLPRSRAICFGMAQNPTKSYRARRPLHP